MTSLGAISGAAAPADALARARERVRTIPDLLVEARRLANTVITGWHGRRQKGAGEDFWQFRPYASGEEASRIDWRRSARDEHTYVRDREWQAAHTVWLVADQSGSMLFQSRLARVSKEKRALIVVLALAELLSRGGERIGWPGLMRPLASRNGAERLAERLVHAPASGGLPDFSSVRRFAEIVVASDFLDPPEAVIARFEPIAARGARGHLIEVCDPAEETFPYAGRTEFRDPETGDKLVAGRAETLADEYRELFLARRESLSRWCRRRGWSYTVTRTDRIASEALAAVHFALSEPVGSGGGR